MAETGRPTSDARTAQDVAVLDHALWSKLENSADPAEFGVAWLALLCQRVSGASRAVLILKSESHSQMEPIAYWPKGRTATAGLSEAAEAALRENRGVARAPKVENEKDARAPDLVDIAQPIRVDDETIGIVAIEISSRPKDALAVAMRDLQWAAAWITSSYREAETRKDRVGRNRLRLAIELFTATLEKSDFLDACRTFATELATELDCDRVTIVRRKKNRGRALAISHSATFDRRTKLVRAIERATDEAIDQWHSIIYPFSTDDGVVRLAQADVSQLNQGLSSLATPLPVQDRAIGGIFLERDSSQPFTVEDALFVETLAALAGPTLEEKRRNGRPVMFKVADSLWNVLVRILGPYHLGRKVALSIFVFAALYLSIVTKPYRVTADARLSGVIERAVGAPFDGFLESAHVRAGDHVKAGETLAQLDTRELEIERLRRMSERNRNIVEYDLALAEGDRAGLNVLRARINQADAQIALLDAQVARTNLVAPFAGIVVSGDLSQRIGDTVARGEVLYEIAPLDEFRVRIAVDERDVEQIDIGQRGRLALTAFPEAPVAIEVTRITPVSEQESGLNFFQVDAAVIDETQIGKLRPGMEGVAKIVIEDRRLVWIWTHRMVDWFRLTLWRWTL